MPKILFIGDIVGKPGRKALAQVLPMWKEKYKPDAVIANTENLAHGKGVTLSTLAQIDELGIDCFTGGNHSFDKEDQVKECFEKYPKLIRPANLPGSFEGHGHYRFAKDVAQGLALPTEQATGLHYSGDQKIVNQQFLVINLHGTVFCEKFFDGKLENPFLAIDRILEQEAQKGDIIFVDFHAEATSEKKTMGYYLDGRVTAVVGTHTHVPTADAHIMKKAAPRTGSEATGTGGTGYITDVGMTGSRDSALGVKFQNALTKFLDPNAKFKNEMEEEGVMGVNGVLIEVGDDQRAVKIEKLYEELT